MIGGRVRNREVVIEVEFSAPGLPQQRVEAIVDTGYNGYLTLPSQVVSALQLQFAGHRRAMLADGSIIRLDMFLATVVWHGQSKDVLISQASGTPLIGMAMLEGNRLTMDVVDGGSVTVEELQQP